MDPSGFRQKGMMTHHGQAHAPPLHITDTTQSWRQPQQPQRDVCTRRGAVHDGFRKGLPEIEQLEREQGLIKGMQALERFMHTHPDYWNESSSQLLLEEVANLNVAASSGEVHDHALFITGLVAPMIEILDAQQETVKKTRQLAAEKDQQATMALQKLQVENNKALQQLQEGSDRAAQHKAFCDSLLLDLEAMRHAAQEAQCQLERKEKEVQQFLEEKQALLSYLVFGGPSAFVEWATEEMQEQGFDLAETLEQAWWPHTNRQALVQDKLPLATPFESHVQEVSGDRQSSSRNQELSSKETNGQNTSDPLSSIGEMEKLLWLIGSEVFQQGVESYNQVAAKGVFSVPVAVIAFWFGLAGRMMSLGTRILLSKLVKQ
ncbi:unnamed protein product [Sphagnum balticum]